MGNMSFVVVALLLFFDILAFLLAVGAERRRSTGKVVPDKYDEKTFCVYDSDASTAYGLSAFGLMVMSQMLIMAVTRCLCCGKGLAGSRRHRCCAIVSFVFSWIIFVILEACLLAGSVKNAYHTKYIGHYLKRDLQSCTALRKGVFAAAAGLILVSLVVSLLLYWSHSRADTGGWEKHRNKGGGIGMTGYDGSQKDEIANAQA